MHGDIPEHELINMPERKILIILRILYLTVCTVIFSIITSPLHAENEEIPKSWSAGAHITWVGEIDSSPENLSITVNGNPAPSWDVTINMYDGLAHVRIGLEYEISNVVTIREGNEILLNQDVFYAHSWESGIVPEEYEMKPFHTAKSEEPCLACHRLKPRESDLEPGNPPEKICFPCHYDKFSGLEFQHKAAGIDWQCLQCHQEEAIDTYYDSPVKFSIEEGMRVAPLCFQCHVEKEKEIAGYKFLHGPVAMSRCNMCHNPHGSNYEKFLQSDITSVCINCHEMQKLLEQPVVHTLVLQKGCTACHDPHGSNYPKSLFDEVKDVCLKCHPKTEEQKNNHPVTGHPVTGARDPNNANKKFSCVSCHNPHAAEFDKLLPVPEVMMFCIKCHS